MLSDRERDIVACLIFDASMSVAEVSSRTGLKAHIVRHTVRKLLEEGGMTLRPYVNPYALGLMEFYAEVSLETPGQDSLATLTRAFVESPTSTFVSEVAGEFHLCVMFLVGSLADIPKFFDGICARVPPVKFTKVVFPVLEVSISYPQRGPNRVGNATVGYRAGVARQRYDELDEKILVALGTGRIASRRELGARCGVPQSTIDYRLQTLQQRGILLTLGYTIPQQYEGLSQYSLRVIASRPCAALHELIAELSRTHPAVRSVLTLSGEIDYVIDVQLSQPNVISAFTQELHRHLDAFISKVDVVPRLGVHKTYVNPDDEDVIRKLSPSA